MIIQSKMSTVLESLSTSEFLRPKLKTFPIKSALDVKNLIVKLKQEKTTSIGISESSGILRRITDPLILQINRDRLEMFSGEILNTNKDYFSLWLTGQVSNYPIANIEYRNVSGIFLPVVHDGVLLELQRYLR